MPNYSDKFVSGVNHFRKKLGISIQELEYACGVSHGYISRIRKGRRTPSLEIVGAFADYFHITVNELLNGGEETLLRYVPVIRCYECKYGHQTVVGDSNSRYCEILTQATYKTFYCGRGELK